MKKIEIERGLLSEILDSGIEGSEKDDRELHDILNEVLEVQSEF
ncbi:hypothetical protein SAMN05443252_10565 [Bacillus sp. OV322]|nr:hypothetical protein [Bacillus sp. OV322]SFC64909.1 hypothetical protein SAMN05443252_10565 [Bacillus sp. OV322]